MEHTHVPMYANIQAHTYIHMQSSPLSQATASDLHATVFSFRAVPKQEKLMGQAG